MRQKAEQDTQDQRVHQKTCWLYRDRDDSIMDEDGIGVTLPRPALPPTAYICVALRLRLCHNTKINCQCGFLQILATIMRFGTITIVITPEHLMLDLACSAASRRMY
jgi:hypothetical protein